MHRIAKASLLATLCLTGGVAAAADAGFYTGFTIGAAKGDIDQGAIDSALVSAFGTFGLDVLDGNSKVSDMDASLGFLVGYRFLPWLAVEGEYTTLGTANYEAHATVTDGSQTLPAKATFETTSKGFALSALGIWPVNETWDLYGRAGVLLADSSADFRIKLADVADKAGVNDNSTDYLLGVGAGFHVSSAWSVRLDYQRFFDVGNEDTTGESSVDRLSLQWIYSF